MAGKIKVANPPRMRPWMIWDGDCNFCGKWIQRWKQATQGYVDYYSYQEVKDRFPEIGEDNFAQAVHLIGVDGVALKGAEAVYACLESAGRYRFLLGMYHRFGWFASLSERAYDTVARNRMVFSKITRILFGASVEYSTFRLSGTLFWRCLGMIYAVAFLSFGLQASGLVGDNGILPVNDYFLAVEEYADTRENVSPLSLIPSLLWLGEPGTVLNYCIWGGFAASILLIMGILPGLATVLCWLCYLSLVNAVPVFLSYQWDALLLETGFLAILFVPWVAWQNVRAPHDPPRIARWLVWWLLFRLMFESGIVKLVMPEGVTLNSWTELTALNFHYFTQPLPNNRSWFIHWLPDWLHQASIIGMLFIELVVPFMILGPRRIRSLAFHLLVFLQILIMASGNYGFFNLLTIVLCLSLIDDQVLPAKIRQWLKPEPKTSRWENSLAPLGWIRIPIACLLFGIGGLQVLNQAKVINLNDQISGLNDKANVVLPVYNAASRFNLINPYGLFRVMTTERPELVIEGRIDGDEWRAYEFRYKAGNPAEPPQAVLGHMPRLDWQMWFAALNLNYQGQYPNWFASFLKSLALQRQDVINLLQYNPFPEQAPDQLRIRLYRYEFTTPEERAETGNWWKRTLRPELTRIIRTDRLIESSDNSE